ncbi:MAG: hypothetical protein AB1801_09740 [Chloroflexota bacterium]
MEQVLFGQWQAVTDERVRCIYCGSPHVVRKSNRPRKNDKPAGQMRRWMYVYLAVDVYTYDLVHLAIYAHNDKDNALAFLRAQGYRPRVGVTDLRRDYGGDSVFSGSSRVNR